MIALYAGENVDRRIVEGLRRRGIDVLTAREAGLTGRVDDARHLQLAAGPAPARSDSQATSKCTNPAPGYRGSLEQGVDGAVVQEHRLDQVRRPDWL